MRGSGERVGSLCMVSLVFGVFWHLFFVETCLEMWFFVETCLEIWNLWNVQSWKRTGQWAQDRMAPAIVNFQNVGNHLYTESCPPRRSSRLGHQNQQSQEALTWFYQPGKERFQDSASKWPTMSNYLAQHGCTQGVERNAVDFLKNLWRRKQGLFKKENWVLQSFIACCFFRQKPEHLKNWLVISNVFSIQSIWVMIPTVYNIFQMLRYMRQETQRLNPRNLREVVLTDTPCSLAKGRKEEQRNDM